MIRKSLPSLLALLLLGGAAYALTKDSVYLPAATDKLISAFVSGDTVARFNLLSDGKQQWGSGSGAVDTNLYRSAADTLKTDDALVVTGALTSGAIAATTGTFTGDLTGDGGDQSYGFLQEIKTASTTALTAADCGKTIQNTGAVVQPLPEASTVLGCRYTFVSGTADDFDIDPADATDHFGPNDVLEASAIDGAAGDEYRLTDIGTVMVIQASLADQWAVVSHNGPITDVN